MDFFILLSSIVGVGGNRGQANYAAGNTFEDEFARCCTTKHHSKTVSLDLGFVVGAGITAENDELVRYFLRRKIVRPNCLVEVFALFDRICDPA
ncbi:KR-domain-containing protein, partial [Byssothecium circinans]